MSNISNTAVRGCVEPRVPAVSTVGILGALEVLAARHARVVSCPIVPVRQEPVLVCPLDVLLK